MNRRDFLKMSSLATMSAVGMWTGITETFAHAPASTVYLAHFLRTNARTA